jgi:hypothetical protein
MPSPLLGQLAIPLDVCRRRPRTAPGAWAGGNQGLSGPANPPNLPSRNTDHQGEVRNVSGNHSRSCNHCPLSNLDRRYEYRPSTDRRAVAYGHTNLVPVIAALAAPGSSGSHGDFDRW